MQRGRVPPTRAVHYSARYLSVDTMLSGTLVWIYRGTENVAFHFSIFTQDSTAFACMEPSLLEIRGFDFDYTK